MREKLFYLLALVLIGTTASAQYTLKNWDVRTAIGGVIRSYSNINEKDIIIPETLNGETVIGIKYMGFRNKGLTKVKFPNTLEIIGWGTFADNKLTSIIIPPSVTLIGVEAFMNNNLTSITIPASVATIQEQAFYNNAIAEINGKPSNGLIYARKKISAGVYEEDKTKIIGYGGASKIINFIPNTVTTIGGEAFANAAITSVTIPPSVTNVEYKAFYNNKLSNLTIPKSVTNIGQEAFAGNALSSIIIPKTVTSIGKGAFKSNRLTSVSISESITSIEESVFENNALSSIAIPKTVASIGKNAFKNNKLINISILPIVKNIGPAAFNKNLITQVNGKISDGLIYARKKISAGVYGEDNTKTVSYGGTSKTINFIPSTVTTIGAYTFADAAITSITMSNAVTTIGAYAFYNAGVTSITIPTSVINIGDHAFSNNKNLVNGIALPKAKKAGSIFKNWNDDSRFVEGYKITIFEIAYTAKFEGEQYTIKLSDVKLSKDGIITAYKNTKEKNIIIPEKFWFPSINGIGEGAFQSKGLTNVELSSRIKTIGANAFAGNPLLKKIILPKILKSRYTFTSWNGNIPANTSISDFSIAYIAKFKYTPPTPYTITDKDVEISKEGIITSCSYKYQDIIIPETLKGITVKGIGRSLFYHKSLKTVVFPNTLETIGKNAFRGTQLISIIIPNSVTSIGEDAFRANKWLTSVTLSNSLTNIEYLAFSYSSLTSITIPNSVTSIDASAFYKNKLTSVIMSNSVTYIGRYAFSGNPNLKSIALPKPKKANYTLLGWNKNTISVDALMTNFSIRYEATFKRNQYILQDSDIEITNGIITAYKNTKETNIIIPENLKGQTVTGIEKDVFKEKKLVKVKFPNTLKTIGKSAFSTNLLVDISIPNSITNIETSVFERNKLANVTIPNSVTSIGASAFYNNLLVSASIPNSVTSIKENAFKDNKLTNITIPSSVISIGAGAFAINSPTSIMLPVAKKAGHVFVNWNGSIPEYTKVTDFSIAYNAKFAIDNSYTLQDDDVIISSQGVITKYKNTTEKNIRIPKTLDGKEVTGIKNDAFKGFSLTNVVLPNTLKIIGERAFSNNNLTSIILPTSVTSIRNDAFKNNKLSNISIPNSVTNIGANAFTGNILKSVTLPTAEKAGYTLLDWNGTFVGGSKVTDLSIAYTASFIKGTFYILQDDDVYVKKGEIKIRKFYEYDGEKGVVYIPARSGYEKKILIPRMLKGQIITSIGIRAFGRDLFPHGVPLTDVIFPNTLKTIKRSAFWFNQLTSITIPPAVTSIGNAAFAYNNLTSVIIPSSVTSIERWAFAENPNLKSITLPKVVKKGAVFQNWNAWNEKDELNKNPTLVLDYKVSDFKKTYKANFRENVILSTKKRVENKLNIYPNPTAGVINISLENSGISQITITNIGGRVILTKKINGNSTKIDLSRYSKGIYFVSIKNNGNTTTKKIVKQ